MQSEIFLLCYPYAMEVCNFEEIFAFKLVASANFNFVQLLNAMLGAVHILEGSLNLQWGKDF